MKRVKILFIVLLGVLTVSAYASETLEKEFQDSFAVNKDAKLKINNKYGTVYLTAWDKNEIKIDVLVKVSSNDKPSKLEELLAGIKVDMSGNSSLVEAASSIPQMRNMKNLSLSIDYHIKLPASIQLDIYQTYGNIIINDNWEGSSSLEVKYGDIQARNLSNAINRFDVAYGDLYAENIEACKLDIAYSDVQIDGINKADIDASYSDIELGKVHRLLLRSGFDDVEVKEVTDVDLRSSYSDFKFRSVLNTVEASLDYGEIEIDYLAPNFKRIKIDSDNSDVEIEVAEKASYSVDVMTRYGDLYIRNKANISKEKLSHSSYRYTGTVGSGKKNGEIIIDADYASIEIK